MSTADDFKQAKGMALIAMTTAEGYATLIQSLIGTLRDQQIISPGQLKVIFLGAAAGIDATPSETEFQKDAKCRMRALVARIGKGFGVEIPPPGQTGIQRKQ